MEETEPEGIHNEFGEFLPKNSSAWFYEYSKNVRVDKELLDDLEWMEEFGKHPNLTTCEIPESGSCWYLKEDTDGIYNEFGEFLPEGSRAWFYEYSKNVRVDKELLTDLDWLNSREEIQQVKKHTPTHTTPTLSYHCLLFLDDSTQCCIGKNQNK